MNKAILAATLSTSPLSSSDDLSLPGEVQWLETRADLAGHIDAAWLRDRFGGQLLYTLRSRDEGGRFDGSNEERRRLLLEAARHYDLIDLEGERDLTPDLLSRIPAHKRIISWSGPPENLASRLDQFSSVKARAYRLVSRSRCAADDLAPLCLLKSLGRPDVIAYAEGHTGFWNRLVAARLGAPIIFGAIAKEKRGRGEPTITQLIEDYALPRLTTVEEIYGIVGSPVHHSLSPRLHNAAYRAHGRAALFVPFHVERFDSFWSEVVTSGTLEQLGLSIKGLTVVSPHKEEAMSSARVSSSMVRRAGSTNIFVRTNGHWTADTTDPEGVSLAIEERGIEIKGRRAAVIGCGGAGRAVAAALDEAGAEVTLVNRGRERGHLAVRLLNLPFVPLSDFSADGFSIVVNATPVGRDDGQMPFSIDGLSEDAVIVDLAYGSSATPLIASALARGQAAIDGREVLLIQVRRQFHLMTGKEMPDDLARSLLGGRADMATARKAIVSPAAQSV
ncbi:MAG: type I 3-dehydroquinate dehydratase [Acidobacteriota bacterium]